MNKVTQAAENFISHDATIIGVEEYGQGLIHYTYLVKLSNRANSFILQRLNTQVFANPEAVMHNLNLICGHIQKRMQARDSIIETDWKMLHGLPARDGRDFFIDADGAFWRALSFIRGAVALERISSQDEARELGRALGTFHFLVSDLGPELLHETLPGFHNVEHYLKKYDEVLGRGREASGAERFCQEFVADRRSWAPVLEKAGRQKILPLRIIHGDPKINNIMVDRDSGKAVSIIDLDTVMPGLVQYDIGDCLRSCCNDPGEEAADLAAVRFDLKLCGAFLSGYTAIALRFLTGTDLDFFFDAIRLIPFELGLRFFTDYLAGNVYFKVSNAEQNLDRALVQFKLVQSIEQQEDKLRAIIEDYRALFTSSISR